jgi:hypothetical protein
VLLARGQFPRRSVGSPRARYVDLFLADPDPSLVALRRSIEAMEVLVVESPGPMPPSRESTDDIRVMPSYAGQSARAVRRVQPADMAELRAGCL